MIRSGAKRFYKDVSFAPGPNGFSILLDGKTVKTPEGKLLCSPTLQLAKAICQEWEAQGPELSPNDMRLTKFLNTALDRMAGARGSVVDALAKYIETELLCYRAEKPVELVERQGRDWDPWLDWAEHRLGVRPRVTQGIVPVLQSEALVNNFRKAVDEFKLHSLVVLHEGITITGSAVLGLAFSEGRLDAGRAWALASLDEMYQAELWGRDAEAERASQNKADALRAAERYGNLIFRAKE